MRRAAAALAALLACGAAFAAAPAAKPRGEPARSGPHPVATPVPLKNAGFENAPRAGERCAEHWSCTMHADPDSFRFQVVASGATEGRQMLCVERVTPEPWALVTQGLHDTSLRGKRLRYSAAVRLEGVEGQGAGPWALVHGPMGNLAHVERLEKGDAGWRRLAVEFPVGATAQVVEVGLTLSGGGRACIDDARLEIVPE